MTARNKKRQGDHGVGTNDGMWWVYGGKDLWKTSCKLGDDKCRMQVLVMKTMNWQVWNGLKVKKTDLHKTRKVNREVDCRDRVTHIKMSRDVTKFAFEFDNVRTSNVFSRFKIRRIFHVPVVEFEPRVYTIGTTCLHPPATGTTNWTNAHWLIDWKDLK